MAAIFLIIGILCLITDYVGVACLLFVLTFVLTIYEDFMERCPCLCDEDDDEDFDEEETQEEMKDPYDSWKGNNQEF